MQNSTLLAFLIANIEKVVSVLTLIIGGTIYYMRISGVDPAPENEKLVFGLLIMNVLFAFLWSGNALLQFICIFGAIHELTKLECWETVETLVLFSVSIFAIVCAIWVAIFTWNNYDEVVSRRMRYINSRASMYEGQWKYTLGRFLVTIVCIFYSSSVIAYACLA